MKNFKIDKIELGKLIEALLEDHYPTAGGASEPAVINITPILNLSCLVTEKHILYTQFTERGTPRLNTFSWIYEILKINISGKKITTIDITWSDLLVYFDSQGVSSESDTVTPFG